MVGVSTWMAAISASVTWGSQVLDQDKSALVCLTFYFLNKSRMMGLTVLLQVYLKRIRNIEILVLKSLILCK